MMHWQSALNGDPIPWLLEEDNPSVRCFTLLDLLDRPADDPAIVEARVRIMGVGIVPRILEKQQAGGYWGNPQDFYIRSKYRGTVWQIIILAALGADGCDPRLRQTCEFILAHAQDQHSGGFAYLAAGEGGDHDKVLPCLTGNMVWSLIRLGYLDDPRVRQGIEWLARYQRYDDGAASAPGGWPYDLSEKCWGTHTCHMGVVKALKALAEIPPQARTPEVSAAIEQGAEYVLKHHVYKRSRDLALVSKPEWLRFGFPLMWNTDALEILGILARLGYHDPRMQEAIDLALSKQDAQGRWTLESTFNGRFQVNIERAGRPSKWITLHALSALKQLAQVEERGV